MNAVQLYNRTLGYIDTARNPRFKSTKTLDSINTAIDMLIKDKYEAGKSVEGQKGFEINQRLKDELHTLIRRNDTSITATKLVPSDSKNNFISKVTITDYMYTIGLNCLISGKWYWTDPMDHSGRQTINDDPFMRPSIQEPPRIWRVEEATGCEVLYGEIGSLTAGNYEYIKLPAKVDIGTEVAAGGSITAGINIIALIDSVISYGGSPYTLKAGEEFTTISTTSVDSGVVVSGYTNCDLPIVLHEEVARRAAAELNLTIENYDKQKALSV